MQVPIIIGSNSLLGCLESLLQYWERYDLWETYTVGDSGEQGSEERCARVLSEAGLMVSCREGMDYEDLAGLLVEGYTLILRVSQAEYMVLMSLDIDLGIYGPGDVELMDPCFGRKLIDKGEFDLMWNQHWGMVVRSE